MVSLRELYRQMARARAFELALADLWNRGLISGEMHLGTGEEGVAAGVVAHLRDGDALALDHRPTPVLVARGVDLRLLALEMLGSEAGLCRGHGGHMHLFSRLHLAASSGIVGSSGPLGAGFALAAKRLRPKAVAVAFFGEGAMNQGMLMESLNLAVAWRLPLVFVCKDNGWAITTQSGSVTGGDLFERARSFGLPASRVDGTDVAEAAAAAGDAILRARSGDGPSFLLAKCPRLDGHMLGDLMLRVAEQPLSTDGREILGKTMAAALSGSGAGLRERAGSLLGQVGLLFRARRGRRGDAEDPLERAHRRLGEAEDPESIERAAVAEVEAAVSAALATRGTGAAT